MEVNKQHDEKRKRDAVPTRRRATAVVSLLILVATAEMIAFLTGQICLELNEEHPSGDDSGWHNQNGSGHIRKATLVSALVWRRE